jgi:hypothetical protein
LENSTLAENRHNNYSCSHIQNIRFRHIDRRRMGTRLPPRAAHGNEGRRNFSALAPKIIGVVAHTHAFAVSDDKRWHIAADNGRQPNLHRNVNPFSHSSVSLRNNERVVNWKDHVHFQTMVFPLGGGAAIMNGNQLHNRNKPNHNNSASHRWWRLRWALAMVLVVVIWTRSTTFLPEEKFDRLVVGQEYRWPPPQCHRIPALSSSSSSLSSPCDDSSSTTAAGAGHHTLIVT